MINIKYCNVCGEAYDYEVCPYCRRKKSAEEFERLNKEVKGDDGIYTRPD